MMCWTPAYRYPDVASCVGTRNPATREVSWNVGAVGASDGEQSVAFQAQIDQRSTLFSNIAEVTWTGGSNNSNPAVVDLIPEPF